MFNQYKNTTWETLRWFYEVSSHFLSNTGDIRLYSCTIGFIVVWKYLHTSCGIKVRLRRVGPKENAGTTFLISARENWPGIDYYPQRRAVATYSIQSSITIPREGLWLRTQFILQKIKLRKGGIPNPTSRRSRTSWRTEGRQTDIQSRALRSEAICTRRACKPKIRLVLGCIEAKFWK